MTTPRVGEDVKTKHNHYTVNFTDGTSLTAHGDSAPAVFDLWKGQEERIGKIVKNVYLRLDADATEQPR